MIFIGIGIFGLISIPKIPIDLFPELEMPTISVITIYPGANTLEVERRVTKVLEEHLSKVNNLKELSSISKENLSVTSCIMNWGTDLNEAANEIRSLVDFARPFLPKDIKPPTVFKFRPQMMPVLMLGITSAKGKVMDSLPKIEKIILNPIRRVPGVGAAVILNRASRQVIIEIEKPRLDAFGLSLQQVSSIITRENLSYPLGYIEMGRMEYTIRLSGEYKDLEELRNTVISQHKGNLVYLKDIAEVKFTHEDIRGYAEVNEEEALLIGVQKRSGANTVKVAELVKAKINEVKKALPFYLKVIPVFDTSRFIRQMVRHLSQAVFLAGIFVGLVVLAFLRRWRSSLIILITIPTSIFIAFLGLFVFNYSINIISLASMAMVVGMVVDNAIVVLENISRHLEEGKDSFTAASLGASEVGSAIFASTLTTLSIFSPLIFVGGLIGIMLKQLAFIVTITLLASLFTALLLTPLLGARFLYIKETQNSSQTPKRFEYLIKGYERLLGWSLLNKKKVIVISILVFILSFGLIWLTGTGFIPQMDSGDIQVTVELPSGTGIAHTIDTAKKIRGIIKRYTPEVQTSFLRAGIASRGFITAMGIKEGPNIATIGVRVGPIKSRSRSTFEIADSFVSEIKSIPGLVNIDIQASNPLSMIFRGDAYPLVMEIRGNNLERMKEAVKIVRSIFEETKGVVRVSQDAFERRPELWLEIDRLKAARLGVSMAAIADTLRTSIYGKVLTKYHTKDEDIDIFLRLHKEDRSQLKDIRDIYVSSLAGFPVRLKNIAKIKERASLLEIRRSDQTRVFRVMADVRGRALGDIAKEIEEKIAKTRLPPGITTKYRGEVKEQRETAKDLLLVLVLGVLLVYMVMASLYNSLIDPLVIMFSVPFAISGVFCALSITNTPLDLLAFFGIIMLVGIVVNNAIVFVDYIGRLRAQGVKLNEAIKLAGRRRLRPILMTAITTICAMTPLAFGRGEGSEMWQSMGIAVIGGLFLSSIVTLVLIPIMYELLEPLRKKRVR
jgi:HAE1 family hydrophobic/amphiphilic exporter-1